MTGRAAALVVAAALALGACSGGDGGDGAGDEAARAPSTTSAESSGTSSTTEPPTFTGDPDSPFCEHLRGFDPASVVPRDGSDPAALEAAFRELIRALRDARALAPPEIEADVAVVTEGIEALDATLAEVGYDFEALAASGEAAAVTEAVDDPAFAEAGARLGAYRSQVCGL